MATPHSSTPRGSRVLGESGKPPAEPASEPETVEDPTRPRHLVDYSLQRRAALRSLRRSGLLSDLCDADPMLLRTAKYHGEATQRSCPICRKQRLTQLTYTFGAEMGQTSGRVRYTEELRELAHRYSAFRVYVVEVCERCSWNHLVVSYVLGDGIPRPVPGARGSSRRET